VNAQKLEGKGRRRHSAANQGQDLRAEISRCQKEDKYSSTESGGGKLAPKFLFFLRCLWILQKDLQDKLPLSYPHELALQLSSGIFKIETRRHSNESTSRFCA